MREKIIATLHKGLEQESFVHAAWLEGSLARGDADKFSDIDLWIDVDDGKENQVFADAESLLEQHGPIKERFEDKKPGPETRHRIYLLGSKPPVPVDVNIQTHSRNFVFEEGLFDHQIKVLFDKDGTIKSKPFDEKKLAKKNTDRLKRIEEIFRARRRKVEVQVKRGKFLEALGYYHMYVLNPLVEALRIAYQPKKTQHGLKYIYQDLPPKVTSELEDLYKVNEVDELPEKLKRADVLFDQAVKHGG